jgi:hypothetical protein
MPACRPHGTVHKRVQSRETILSIFAPDFTMAFDAYGSRVASSAMPDDPGYSWCMEFEASTGFPTG